MGSVTKLDKWLADAEQAIGSDLCWTPEMEYEALEIIRKQREAIAAMREGLRVYVSNKGNHASFQLEKADRILDSILE